MEERNIFAERLKIYSDPATVKNLSKKRITARGEIIDEIVALAAKQKPKLNRKTFFILLSPYKEKDLRYIKSLCLDKVRQGYSVEKYIQWLRKK